MDLLIKGKTALVSASSAGIGLAIAARLAAEGATVYINSRTAARVKAGMAAIRKQTPGAKLHPLVADIGTKKGADKAIRALKDVDILVNNLGIYEPKPFEKITDADWTRIFEVNVLSGIRLSRHYLPGMLRRNWGRIIFISSESAYQIPAEMIHYGVTKAAQIAVSRGLAEITAATGITVNTVLPGPTRSRGVEEFVSQMAAASGKTREAVEQEFFQTARPTSLIKRFATPEEVASLVAYVASPLASATTGAALRVDGGVVKGAF